VGGDPNLENFEIDIEITDYLRFRLETNYSVLDRCELHWMVGIPGLEDATRVFKDGTFTATLPQADRSMEIFLRLRDIGSGESSKVTKGWDVSTGAVYAIKEPRREPKDDINFDEEKWKREINAMALIWNTRAHEQQAMSYWRQFIIKLIWASSPEHPILIYEYCALGTVKEQHARRRMSAVEAGRIFFQCVRALAFLDEILDLQHGDIRPEHVLVMDRSSPPLYDDGIQVKLIGFGEAANSTRYFRGMLPWDVYRWPPVWSKKNPPRPAADIWSAAMVALELIHSGLLPASERDCATLKNRVYEASLYANQSTRETLTVLLKWMPPL
jgi:serine/threonine protein kinase